MLADKKKKEGHHDELTLQLRDEKGHLTHYKRVIRVRNLQQATDGKDADGSSQAQTLLGKQLWESSKANGSTPIKGKEESKTMALVSKKGSDERRLSELFSASSAEPASLVGPVRVSPSLLSKEGPIPAHDVQMRVSQINVHHAQSNHLPSNLNSNKEYSKQGPMKYEIKPPTVKNIREFKLVYGRQQDGWAFANERNFGQGWLSLGGRSPTTTQTKTSPAPMATDGRLAQALQYRQNSAAATGQGLASKQRDHSKANIFGVPLAGDKEVVEALDAK